MSAGMYFGMGIVAGSIITAAVTAITFMILMNRRSA